VYFILQKRFSYYSRFLFSIPWHGATSFFLLPPSTLLENPSKAIL